MLRIMPSGMAQRYPLGIFRQELVGTPSRLASDVDSKNPHGYFMAGTMPYSEKQRRAMWAEIRRRKKGGKARNFKGMSLAALRKHAKAKLKKKH